MSTQPVPVNKPALGSSESLPPPRVYELCHVGVVLRALLGVHSVLALLLALEARSVLHWAQRFADACAISVPALLGWLLVVCALKLRLAAWSPPRVRIALVLLGAFCAVVPTVLGDILNSLGGQLPSPRPLRLLGVAGCGGLAAGALLSWLSLRARAQGPSTMQARWVELQARIRPHFLFNTLNTAVALVRLDPQRAERVLEDLAELFQAALASPAGTSTLAQEVELARRYLDIEQLRFGERLRLHWSIDPAAGPVQLPPLLLQPLVENAVRYGVEPNEAGGDVWVSVRRQGSSRVELLVRNTLDAPARPGHGMALANVRERLLLLHDVAARFEVQAEARQFSVRLQLPV